MAAAGDRGDLECSAALHQETRHDRSDTNMRPNDGDTDLASTCSDMPHALARQRDTHQLCTLCQRRVTAATPSRPAGNGRAHSACLRGAENRPASRKRRQLRAPSPPSSPREPSRRRREAASAMASLSAVVAELKNSDSAPAVESEPASTSASEPPAAAAAAASAAAASATSNPPADARLPHSRFAAPLNSEHLRAHPKEMMKAYDYAMLDPTETSVNMAERIAKLDLTDLIRPDMPHRFSVISGDVGQVNLTSTPQFTRSDQREWETIMTDAFRRCGLEQETSDLHLVATKALDAAPGCGEQSVHFDSADAWAATDRFSVILVCSEGTHTTAMPRFCASTEFPWQSADDVPPRELQRVCHLLDAEWYHRVPAKIGTIIIFRESVPHHGTRNPKKKGDRRVLFSMWSSKKDSSQDGYQEYPWMTIAKAYGANSIETARALVEYAAHDPINRMDAQTKKEYAACLREHRLLTKFNAASSIKQ